MIRVAMFFPNDEGSTFNHDYYLNRHIPMAKSLLEPVGLIKMEVEKGISDTDPNAPPRFHAISGMIFNSVEEVHSAFISTARELLGDTKNYTDVKPMFQISEILT